MIKIENIWKCYPSGESSIKVLNAVTAQLNEGSFVSIRGASGCGKSTLLLILGGLLSPDSGSVQIAGKELLSMAKKEQGLFRAKNIGYVFQQFHLFPYLTVEDNIKAASLAIPEKNVPGRAEELMRQLHVYHRKHHVPGRLSVGEKQRVALGRAMFNNPGLLLADEPTGNLDPDNTETVLEVFKQFTEDGGTVVAVTHDIEVASSADQQWILNEGKLILKQ